MRTYVFLIFTAAVCSYLTARWLASAAAERGWARRRDNAGGNGEGIPRLGGVAVYLSALVAIALLVLWDNQVADRLALQLPQALALGGTATAVFLLGLYDDLRGARPWQKLIVQLMAGAGLWLAGFRVEVLTNPFTEAPIELGWASLPITLLWLAAISNAFNLIDGLDGLAAGVGLFSTVTLFLLAMLAGGSFIAAITAALAGALIGFLPHNFFPARIYLGDSGSLTIGLTLAALAVQGAQKGPVLITVSIPLVVFGLPLLDVGVTTVRRFLSGHPIFHRDEEHLHHRLVKLGLTQRVAVLVLYGVSAVFALGSLLLLHYRGAVAPLIALLSGTLSWLLVRQMKYPEFTELDSHVRQALAGQRAVLRNQILIRKAAAAVFTAQSTEEVWSVAEHVFGALGFDRAECFMQTPFRAVRKLRWIPGGEAASEIRWSHDYWNLAVPLVQNSHSFGTLTLFRSLERGPLLFRVSSLVGFVTEALAPRLASLAEDEPVTSLDAAVGD